MSLLETDTAAVARSTAELLADWLLNGKPELGWKGDPRLELHIGILRARHQQTRNGKTYRKGDVMAYRFEVKRHTEEGKLADIISRPVDQWTEIIPELVKIDPRTPGFENSALLAQKANEAIEKKQSEMFADSYGAAAEHQANINHERYWGKTFFGGGLS